MFAATGKPTTNKIGNPLTLDQFRKVLPAHKKNSITGEVVDEINSLLGDPILRENYRDNLLGFTSVLMDGKFGIDSYVDAIRFVSFRLMGNSTIDAYTRAFPDRYQRMLNDGRDNKFMCTLASSYNKNILVNKILEQTLIPTHILNAGMYQDALNVQHELMHNAKSEHVRMNAADSIMTQLRPPEIKKMELDINVGEDKSIQDIRATTLELVAQQRKMIEAGVVTVKEIAHSRLAISETIVDGEVVNE